MRFTPQQLQAFEAFCDDVERLEHACAHLKCLLDEAYRGHRVRVRTFELPRIKSDFGPPPERIEPLSYSGHEGYRLARQALSDWYAVPGYATKAVHRTPGVLCVRTDDPRDAENLTQQVALINRLKGQLRQHSKAMGNPEQRHELIHRRYYMLVLAQLTRAITLLSCPPDLASITFSWGFKTEIKRIDVDEACRILEQMRPLVMSSESDAPRSWSDRVSDEQARLRSLHANTSLRWRRPLPARPLANLRWFYSSEEIEERREARQRGVKVDSPTFMREAHTPIIVLNPKPEFRIGELGIFDQSLREQRKPRNDRLCELTAVTPLAPIYRIRS